MSSTDRLKKELQKKATDTVMKLMADDRTRPVVAKAMQTYMQGRQRVDTAREETLHSLGLVSRSDLQSVQGRLRRLGRRVDEIEARLGKLAEAVES